MGWECFCVVGFDLGPLLQGGMRILHLQYFFKYVLTYFLHLNSYLVTFLHNTICRAQLFCPFLLSASEFLSNMLFNYHLMYFCTALSLIIMLSSHYHLHKSKTLSQLTQCPFTGTLLLFFFSLGFHLEATSSRSPAHDTSSVSSQDTLIFVLKGALDCPFFDPSMKVHLRWYYPGNYVFAYLPLIP